jgi:hypothetical protein
MQENRQATGGENGETNIKTKVFHNYYHLLDFFSVLQF